MQIMQILGSVEPGRLRAGSTEPVPGLASI